MVAMEVAARMYFEDKKSSLEIAAALGISKSSVLRALRKIGPLRPLREAFSVSSSHASGLRMRGEQCMSWKGGRKISGGGYVSIMLPAHPNADRFGYVLEHRLIVEKEIGRYLDTGEHVHHKNGDKSDNRLENLEVLTRARHMSEHAKVRPRHARGYFTTKQEEAQCKQ